MLRRSLHGNPPWLLLICLLVVLVSACGSKEKYAGTYTATAGEGEKRAESVLNLKENGEGSWKVGEDEVTFSWYIKNGELRVNTKGGGVLVGSLEGDAIRITLPGFDTLSFKKLQ